MEDISSATIQTAAEDPAKAAKKTLAEESIKAGFKVLPYLADIGVWVADYLGFKSLSRRIDRLHKQINPDPKSATVIVATDPAQASKAAASHSDIPPAPFGLTSLTHQDEARMKRIWDGTQRSFREMRPTTAVTNPGELCFNFARLAMHLLNTYHKQEMLRDVITRDPNDRKAVEGAREMVFECQTPERLKAYMFQIGVLTQSTDADLAREKAADVYRKRDEQIKAASLRRRLRATRKYLGS